MVCCSCMKRGTILQDTCVDSSPIYPARARSIFLFLGAYIHIQFKLLKFQRKLWFGIGTHNGTNWFRRKKISEIIFALLVSQAYVKGKNWWMNQSLPWLPHTAAEPLLPPEWCLMPQINLDFSFLCIYRDLRLVAFEPLLCCAVTDVFKPEENL